MKDVKKLIVTHNAKFHADDAFAVAALLLHVLGHAKVVRTRDQKIIESGAFVVDVGGVYDEARNRFDHHQTGGAGERANGIPYAAFGLVWKKFGAAISGSAEIAASVDETLIQPIDAADNGVALGKYAANPPFPYFIQDAIFSFAPTWSERAHSFDAGFEEARSLATTILTREIAHAHDTLAGERLVLRAYEQAGDKRIIVLDEKYDWTTLIGKPEPLFVVYPDSGPEKHWRARTIPLTSHSFESRASFPRAWAGKCNKELAKVSGVSDAVFCHNKLFTIAARTKEGAIELTKLAL